MKSKFYELWDQPGPLKNVQKISETILSKSSLLVFLLWMIFISSYSQTTPLSFTQIPYGNNDILAPGRGTEHWFSTAPWDNGTMVQTPNGNTKGLDYYIRLNWAQIENAGSGTTAANPRYNWSTFDFYVNTAINNGWKFHFGILCMAEGYAPFGTQPPIEGAIQSGTASNCI